MENEKQDGKRKKIIEERYSILEYNQYWNKIIINECIPPTLFAFICIPKGIRARVRVNPNPNPNSLETSCHGNLLFTRPLIGQVRHWYTTHW